MSILMLSEPCLHRENIYLTIKIVNFISVEMKLF